MATIDHIVFRYCFIALLLYLLTKLICNFAVCFISKFITIFKDSIQIIDKGIVSIVLLFVDFQYGHTWSIYCLMSLADHEQIANEINKLTIKCNHFVNPLCQICIKVKINKL